MTRITSTSAGTASSEGRQIDRSAGVGTIAAIGSDGSAWSRRRLASRDPGVRGWRACRYSPGRKAWSRCLPTPGAVFGRPARVPAGDATTVATAKSCRGTTRVRSEAERPCQSCQVRGEAGIDGPNARGSDGSCVRFRISANVHTARKDRGSGSVTPEPAIGQDLPGEPGQLSRSVKRSDTPACTG